MPITARNRSDGLIIFEIIADNVVYYIVDMHIY